MSSARVTLLALLALAAGCGSEPGVDCGSWTQWGNGGAHTGQSCSAGQALGSALADEPFDPFIAQEVVDSGGDLVVHYQAPLLAGDDVYMMRKSGTYQPCEQQTLGSGSSAITVPACFEPDELFRLNSEVWREERFTWDASGALTRVWSFASDWKPEPEVSFEPMFQPALAGDLIAVPGANGALWELDRASGAVVRHVEPFTAPAGVDVYVAGGLAVAPDGGIYYNAIELDHAQPYALDGRAFFVRVDADGVVTTVDYAALVPGAPGPNDLCYTTFDAQTTALPWPPADQPDGSPTLPPQLPCGSQRPGMNAAPAIGADGTIFVATRARFDERYSYLVALNPDLSPRWATSLRGLVQDGCGVLIPSDGSERTNPFDCRAGAAHGVDPATNQLPAPAVDDDSSASPVALPDGGVLYGAFTTYNGFRGHLLKLDQTGAFAGAYDFGWDSSPALVPRADGGYDIVTKDNHYGQDAQGVDLGPYYLTELDSDLHVRWKFLSTNTQSCARGSDGTVACTEDHPHGFEWCINAPAVDSGGVVYANSEDGTAYAIEPDGKLRDSFFLGQALGAAYTPVTIDYLGRVYAINSGHMIAIGSR